MTLNSVAAGAPCRHPALKAFWVQQRGDGDSSGRRREAPSLGHWAHPWQGSDSSGLGGSGVRLELPEGGLLGEKRPAPRPQQPPLPPAQALGAICTKEPNNHGTPTKGEARGTASRR